MNARFFLGSDLYAVHRNALILSIADTVGIRRASITSLTAGQFKRDALERARDTVVWIKPSSQKFSYDNMFGFPVWLALRICEFCETYRASLLRSKGKSEGVALDRIFLSARDARPLTERAMTQIFSKAMRELGAPKGAALHTFRAKFANDEIERELFMRSERGMDTSANAVATAVALKLGHRNIESIYTYVVAAQSASSRRQKFSLDLG